MTVNDKTRTIFSSLLEYTYITYQLPSGTLDDNQNFYTNMVIDISKELIELPIMARGNWILVNKNLSDINFDKAYLPLCLDSDTIINNSSLSILENMKNIIPEKKLKRVTLGKEDGEVYYIGRGLILDSKQQPIFMLSDVINKEFDEGKFIIHKFICRINPKVFIDKSVALYKYIVNKIIPLLMDNKFYIPNYKIASIRSYTQEAKMPITLIVEDFDKFFITACPPKCTENIQEHLSQTIIDNKANLLDSMFAN